MKKQQQMRRKAHRELVKIRKAIKGAREDEYIRLSIRRSVLERFLKDVLN